MGAIYDILRLLKSDLYLEAQFLDQAVNFWGRFLPFCGLLVFFRCSIFGFNYQNFGDKLYHLGGFVCQINSSEALMILVFGAGCEF